MMMVIAANAEDHTIGSLQIQRDVDLIITCIDQPNITFCRECHAILWH